MSSVSVEVSVEIESTPTPLRDVAFFCLFSSRNRDLLFSFRPGDHVLGLESDGLVFPKPVSEM
jgi:hypothetical protein